MPGMIENSYGEVVGTALKIVRPFKNIVKRPECRVHKFINLQSVNILGNDGNAAAWEFFNRNMRYLNSGVVWADQDMKGSNHFYNPYSKKGLYGFSNAMKEGSAYYEAALAWWRRKDAPRAIICLGAACHIIQDMTVPQHVRLDLLNNHRRFENWIIDNHEKEGNFRCSGGGIYLDNVNEHIVGNAYTALDVYKRNAGIRNLGDRFYYIAGEMLCQAQRSTAGLLQLFCSEAQI